MSWLDREDPVELCSLLRIGAILVSIARFSGTFSLFAQTDWPHGCLAILFWGAAVCGLVGLWARPAVFLTGFTSFLAYVFDGHGGQVVQLGSHHVLAQSMLCMLLATTPCGGAFSIRPAGPGALGPGWGLWLLRLHVCVLYLGAVYEKLNWGFLSGQRLEQITYYIYLGSDWLDVPGLRLFCMVSAWLTVVIEAYLAIVIWRSQWAKWTWLLAAIFHGLVYLAIPVSTFSATMLVGVAAAFAPRDVHQWLREQPRTILSTTRWPSVLLVLMSLVPVFARWVPMGHVPTFEIGADLGERVCDVTLVVDGLEVGIPRRLVPHGRNGVHWAAYRACQRGHDVQLFGHCGSDEGWDSVADLNPCEEPDRPLETQLGRQGLR